MNIYNVDFEGMYPVGNVLIIRAASLAEAYLVAMETITHTSITIEDVKKVELESGPQVIAYLSGDY